VLVRRPALLGDGEVVGGDAEVVAHDASEGRPIGFAGPLDPALEQSATVAPDIGQLGGLSFGGGLSSKTTELT
jgi:hypothetical protein